MVSEIRGTKRGFVCGRYPNFNIRDEVVFENAFFETDDPEKIALIERNDWYRVYIHDVQTQEEIDAMRGGAPVDVVEPASDVPVAEEIAVVDEVVPAVAEEIAVEDPNPATGRSRARAGQTHTRSRR